MKKRFILIIQRKKFNSIFLLLSFAAVFSFIGTASALTTAFTYQGKLTDNGSPASGNYFLQFKMFDPAGGGTQIGATISDIAVVASNGFFTTKLDFEASAFPGADRFLEIAVKKTIGDSYTTLSPREQITSSPYSIRTLSAAQADVALDSNKLGGVVASEYVTTSSVGNSFIKNSATQQIAEFNISGNGIIGGNLGVGTTAPTTKLQVRTASGNYGLTQTDGTITVGSYVGSSSSGATGGWLGTLSNNKLLFFTNNGQPSMTVDTNGNVGIGTTAPQAALHVAGNTVQDRNKGGMIKALLYVAGDGTILNCYNGVTGVSTGNCGFSITGNNGLYEINFGFQVSDRFFSVATSSNAFINNTNTSAQVGFDTRRPNTVLIVRTFVSGDVQTYSASNFFITVY